MDFSCIYIYIFHKGIIAGIPADVLEVQINV